MIDIPSLLNVYIDDRYSESFLKVDDWYPESLMKSLYIFFIDDRYP